MKFNIFFITRYYTEKSGTVSQMISFKITNKANLPTIQ